MKRRSSGTNFSSENNLPTFQLNALAVISWYQIIFSSFMQKPTEKPLEVWLYAARCRINVSILDALFPDLQLYSHYKRGQPCGWEDWELGYNLWPRSDTYLHTQIYSCYEQIQDTYLHTQIYSSDRERTWHA